MVTDLLPEEKYLKALFFSGYFCENIDQKLNIDRKQIRIQIIQSWK